MSKSAPDDDNVGRRSSRRSSVSEADVKVSRGGPVNAARLDRDVLKKMASENSTKYLSRIDFCKLSDDDIAYIFVTERTYKRFRDKLIIFPPDHFKRDASNIKRWFNEFGAAARQQVIDDCSNVKILIDHDDTLQWSIEEDAWGKETLPQPQVSAPPPSSEPSRFCNGFMMKDIEAMRLQGDEQEREARRENIILGFKHTIREGYVTRSAVSQPNNDMWQFCPPITGVILHGNDNTKARWTVEEDQHEIGEDQFEHHKIRAVGCTRLELNDNDVYCVGCAAEKRALLQRFDSNVKLREGEFDPRTRHNVLGRSASLQKQATDYHRRESKNKMKKISRRDKVIAKLEESTGIDVKMNKHTDYLFHPDVEAAGKKFLSEEVGKDSLSEYAFARSMHNHRVAKQSGVHAVRHCPLMIRFAATIRRAMGHKGGLFDLVAKVAGLPTSRTLRKYQVSNSNDPDGMMHKNIARARATYKQKNPNAGRFDYSRHTVMALDSMHTKGRFGVSRNTNELVGVADDAFKNDVILNELNELEKNGDTDNEAEMKLPGMAKHFLVFIATTWTPKGKIQFLVARYGLPTITSQTLLREIEAAIVTCALYGFIIDTISGDGASENRLTWKTLATISAREILGKHWSEEELEGLPLDFKIGFQHPHPMYKDKVTIIIGGEMPHWVKKFRNAFENESRELTFRGKPMNLNQLYEMWKASGDADVVGGASVRLYKFTHDHFKLNAYLKMRVFLAVQIPSQTMITMIKGLGLGLGPQV